MLTLVRRSDERVLFLVCKDLEDGDEDIAEYGDELDDRLDELSRELASGPTWAYGVAKQLLTQSFDQSH